MSKVFVLDTTKQPLNPVHPGLARLLLKEGKAAVYRRYPFTIILKTKVDAPTLSALRLKLDPGSKTSGLALLDDASGEVVLAAQLSHRGASIKKRLDGRRSVRHKRRVTAKHASATVTSGRGRCHLHWKAGSPTSSLG